MQKNLEIEIGDMEEAGYQVIKFVGEFDKAGYTAVRESLVNGIEKFSGKTLIFNFDALKFINSEGIGHLMEVHAHLTKDGKKLVIIGPNSHVGDVFKAIGLSEIIPTFAKMDDFLKK